MVDLQIKVSLQSVLIQERLPLLVLGKEIQHESAYHISSREWVEVQEAGIEVVQKCTEREAIPPAPVEVLDLNTLHRDGIAQD